MILHMMNKAKAPCGTHGSEAVKVFPFSDFDFAEPFGSAFLFSTKKVDLSARSCPNKFGRDARLMINFLPECHPERSPKGEVEGSLVAFID